jgi:hypothetical protein
MGAAMKHSLFLIKPKKTKPKQWLDANVDYQLLIEEGIPIDHRHVLDVLAGLQEAGLEESTDFEVVQ